MKNLHTHKWQKSVFSLLIVMAMIFSMLPVSAFAGDTITLGDSNAATPATTDGGLILIGGEDDPDALLECNCVDAGRMVKCTNEERNTDCPVCANNPEWCLVGVEPPDFAAMSGSPTRTTTLNLASTSTDLSYNNGSSTITGVNPSTTDVTDSAEGWAWNQGNKTLTLNGLNMSVTNGNAIKLPDGAKIELIGTNTITSTYASNCIDVYPGSLTIEGGGTLNVDGTANAIGVGGTGATLTINGGTINANSTSGCGLSIPTSLSLIINGGTITATGGYSAISTDYTVDAWCLYQVNTNNTPGGTEETSDGNFVIGSSYKYAKITYGEDPTINYTLFLDDNDNGKLKKNDASGTDVTSTFTGKATVSGGQGARILTLNGLEFETSAAVALEVPAGTTIEVTDDSSITSTYAETGGSAQTSGIYSTGNLTIDVATGKTLTTTGGVTESNSHGIKCAANFEKKGAGTLIANGGKADTNNSYGILVTNNLTVTAGTILASADETSLGNKYAVRGNTATLPTGIKVKAYDGSGYNNAASFVYAGDLGAVFIKDTNGNFVANAKLTVLLTAPLDFTTGVNQSGDGYVWNEATKTLTLTDFDMDIASTNARAIRLPAGATIVLNGDNSILTTSGYDAISAASGGTFTIQGTGSLDIASVGMGIIGDTITVKSGTLNIAPFGAGIKSDTGINIEGGTVTINAGANALYTNGGITVSGGTVTANSETTSAIYVEAGGTFTVTGGSVTATTDDSASYGLNGAADVNVSVTGGTLALTGGTYGMICKNFTMTGGTVFSKGTTNALMIKGTFTTGLSAKIGTAYTSSAVFFTSPNSGYTSIKTAATNGTDVTDAKITVASGGTAYTVTYNGNGSTSGTVPTDSTQYASGATVTVKTNSGTLARTGYAFTGWNTKADGTGTSYTAGTGTFTISANTTLYAKWTETYTVSGTVKDYLNDNVSGATVTIMLGRTQIATTTTPPNGTFNFTDIIPGLYNLVIVSGDQKITVIVTVTNASVAVPATSTKFPQYIQNSVVKVEAAAPVQAVVGGLQEVYDTPVADNTKGFTAADIAAIESGATGEIKVVVDAIQATADQTAIENAATGKTVGLFIDLSVFKTITPIGGSGTTTQLAELPGLLAVTFDLPTELQGKTITAIYRVHDGVVETITTSGAEYFSQNGDAITLHVKKFSTYGLAYTDASPTPTPTPTPTPGGGSSGGSGKQYTPAPNPWLEPAPAQNLATAANKAKQDSIRTKSGDTYGVRKASWQKLKGYRYYHDTMAAGAVGVRLYIDNPAALTRDMYVTGFVKGYYVDNSKAMFEKWFTNKIRVIHMDEAAPWGQEVQIAAKVDLAGMDTKKLYFYSYDKKANKYTRIAEPKYWIDQNGYLRFYTGLAGDIIISDGALEKK